MRKIFTLLIGICGLFFASCASSSLLSAPAASYALGDGLGQMLGESFQKSAVLVQRARMNVTVKNVGIAGKQLESIVLNSKGFTSELEHREDKASYADYVLRVPSNNLKNVVDSIGELGKVTFQKITIEDVSSQKVRYEAKLKELYNRRSRYQELLKQAVSIKDKIALEEQLAQLEGEIFKMNLAAKDQKKYAAYSVLKVRLDRKVIQGPVGAALQGMSWGVKKLFTIRE